MNINITPKTKKIAKMMILVMGLEPIFGSELGIKSKTLTAIITERDKLIEKVINSSFFFTGINIPRHPIIVESPAIEAKIKGQTSCI